MSKVRYVDFNPAELLADIAGELTLDEFSLYWMICTLIYSRRQRIDDDAEWLKGKFKKADLRRVRTALDGLVAKGKVCRSGGKLYVNRCETELERAEKRIETAQENGRNGGRPSKEINNLENQPGLSEKSYNQPPLPTTNNQQSKKKEDAPSAKKYAWEGKIVRFEPNDFAKLKKTYHAIPDIEAELFAADAYYSENPPPSGRWYFPVMGWLKREHQKHLAATQKSEDFNSLFP